MARARDGSKGVAAGRARGSAYAKGARITGDSRDRLQTTLREQYEAGASIRSLADRTGRSYGFVHKVLAESGTVLRSRGGPNRKKVSATT